jgi:hypothetical protein
MLVSFDMTDLVKGGGVCAIDEALHRQCGLYAAVMTENVC